MEETIIYIRPMVSPLDILQVSRVLQQCGVQVKEVELGAAAFINAQDIPYHTLQDALEEKGYQVITKADKEFLHLVKQCVCRYLEEGPHLLNQQLLSESLEEQLPYSYSYISKRFSRLEGQTLESYCISQKIAKIKALLRETDLDMPTIALKLRYNSKAYMARQFKEQTGQSMVDYRRRQHGNPMAISA